MGRPRSSRIQAVMLRQRENAAQTVSLRALFSAIFFLLAIGLTPHARAQNQTTTAAGSALNARAGQPGAALFAQHCATCHGDQGEGRSAQVSMAGPNLQAEHDLTQVEQMVRHGRNIMPSFERVLTPPEIDSVAYYVTTQIATIPLSGGDIPEGGELYRTYCAGCHRTAVRGGALAFVGTNAPDLADKSLAIVAGAIRWGPGPMPSFPETMLNDQQLASIVDYVGAVQHPPHPGGHTMHWFGPTAEGLAAAICVLLLGALTMWIEKGGKG